MASRKRNISKDEDVNALYKEWDEVSCPICMEHPHNAVLLLCNSHDKGCRSYVCDTSYRHSNCLDRYRRLQAENRETATISLSSGNQHDATNTSGRNLGLSSSNESTETYGNQDAAGSLGAMSLGLPGESGYSGNHSANEPSLERVGAGEFDTGNSSQGKLNLRCPLCRGTVLGWEVVEESRRYLNQKQRCCSRESCLFSGNYRELRRHARRVHPTVRPADIDPSRQQAWRRLEDRREYDDIVSAVRSAMPGAIVLGDYVIENGDRLPGERERGSGDNGRWLSTFFLFQMIGSMDRGTELRGGRSRALSRHRRSNWSRRRYLWGENLLRLQNGSEGDEDDGDDGLDLNMLSDVGNDDVPLNPRRRRRLTRSRSDEDQS